MVAPGSELLLCRTVELHRPRWGPAGGCPRAAGLPGSARRCLKVRDQHSGRSVSSQGTSMIVMGSSYL